MPKIVASIEARMRASRLPGKVLKDINGAPALTRLVRRLRRCRCLDDLVVATSVDPSDDAVERWAASEAVTCYRGSHEDVLGRVVEAHHKLHSDIIVEVTGDSVLTDPEAIDWGVDTFLANACDVVTNVRPPSWPMGVDVQVFRAAALEAVAARVRDPVVREHVSLYFYEHPKRYRLISLPAPRRWWGPRLRFQLDYPEDLAFIRAVYWHLEPDYGDNFGLDNIMALLKRQPALLELNRHCQEKPVR